MRRIWANKLSESESPFDLSIAVAAEGWSQEGQRCWRYWRRRRRRRRRRHQSLGLGSRGHDVPRRRPMWIPMIPSSSYCLSAAAAAAAAAAEVPDVVAVVADVHDVHETAWPLEAVDGASESSHDEAAPRVTTRLKKWMRQRCCRRYRPRFHPYLRWWR